MLIGTIIMKGGIPLNTDERPMSAVLVLWALLVAVSCGPMSHMAKPKRTLSGVWRGVFSSEGEQIPVELVLAQTGSSISGSVALSIGDQTIDLTLSSGVLTDGLVSIRAGHQGPGGYLRLSMDGKVEGDVLKGRSELSGIGMLPIGGGKVAGIVEARRFGQEQLQAELQPQLDRARAQEQRRRAEELYQKARTASPEKRIDLLQQACDAGSLQACEEAAFSWQRGFWRGTRLGRQEPDPKMAEVWLRKVCGGKMIDCDRVSRFRQHVTMGDMRSLGTALGSYRVDYHGYPANVAGIDSALAHLDPDYALNPPTRDWWGHPLRYEAHRDRGVFASTYTLTSPGADGAFQGFRRALTKYFDCDIIYKDGRFVQSPKGLQRS